MFFLKYFILSFTSLILPPQARYNQFVDYPVVIFHDGLSMASRLRIFAAAGANRIWFANVTDFTDVPLWIVNSKRYKGGTLNNTEVFVFFVLGF
jgi:hypothetical protein